MTVDEFNQQGAGKGYQLQIRDGKLRNIPYTGRYLSLQNSYQSGELAKFPCPQNLVDVPQEVFDSLDYLSKH